MAVDDQDPNAEPEDPSELVRHLRKEINDRNKLIQEQGDARRELAFVKAGIDTSTKLGALFAKSFDGDVNDLEAIKAEAQELGLIKAPGTEAPAETSPEATPPPAGDSSAQERSALATGAAGDDGAGVDPREVARARAEEALKQGATFEHAAGGYIAELAAAAVKGDQRVIIPNGNAY